MFEFLLIVGTCILVYFFLRYLKGKRGSVVTEIIEKCSERNDKLEAEKKKPLKNEELNRHNINAEKSIQNLQNIKGESYEPDPDPDRIRQEIEYLIKEVSKN